MADHVKEFYQQFSDETSRGRFHKVIALHENKEINWKIAQEKAPELCKGWFELAQLNPKDRVEFCRDFWLTKMPFHPHFPKFLTHFFSLVDDVEVFLVQPKFDDPFEAHMVYSMKNDAGFFRGFSGATEKEILLLQQAFSEFILPNDYLAFLEIHNGFCKTTDMTGITKSTVMEESYKNFQIMLAQQERLTTTKSLAVNPKTLIPFYESFGMPFFQCFWAEWYPEQEMGNVYYSGKTKMISDIQNPEEPSESMAFPTFTDWLMFYLEQIE